MRRLCICIALIFAAGCAYPPSKVDLLYGQQLIPAPSTASTAGQPTGGTGQQPPGDDYYNQPPTGGTGTGAGSGTGSGSGTGGFPSSGGTSGDRYSPTDGFDYGGATSSSRNGTGFQEVSNSSAAGNAGSASGGGSSAASDPFSSYNNTSAPPRTFPDDGRVAPRNTLPANTAPNNINSGSNLPGTSGQTTPNATGNRYENYTPSDVQPDDQASTSPGRFVPPSSTQALNRSGVQPVSYSRVVTESNGRSAASSRGSYDYDANYAWLRGQLDYSQSERRWKLRYIPITGETDNFGGSVILSGEGLDAFRSGEFVTVHGQLDGNEVERGGFAPLYNVQRISRPE